MITLNEKRLQELERKHTIYEATIAELKKKLDEVNTFPKDIQEVKDKLKSHRSDLDSLHNTTNQKVNETTVATAKLQTNQQFLSESLRGLQSVVDSFHGALATHAEKLIVVRSAIGDLTSQMTDVLVGHRVLHERLSKNEGDFSVLGETVKGSLMKANNAQIDATAALNKATQQDKTLAIHADNAERILSENKRYADQSIVALEKRLHPKDPLPAKSYDAEIAEIRKDIDSIRALLNSAAAKVPDQSQITSKIKSLETAIAEIFTLLKQYSTR